MKPQVVIVDDTRTTLSVLQKRLIELDLDVVSFLDPKECLTQLESLRADVFILDVEMPGLNGFQLCRQIKDVERFKDAPVLFFTSSQGDQVLREAFESGGFDFLPKSVTAIELQLRVRNALDIVRLQRDLKHRATMFEILLRVMYHDLATPLMIGQSRVLSARESVQEESVRKNLNTVIKAMDTMSALTKDIRVFFTEDANAGHSLVSDVIADLDFLLRDRLERKNVKVNWSYDPDQVSSLAIPKTFLVNQVIANFLTNAIKFSPSDGVIDVAFSFVDQFGRIIIQDYGVGMDEIQLKSVLEGRPKALGVGTSGELGSGSGVLIAQFFLKKFNGSISIESVRESDSKAESGTKVIICVPTV